MPKGLGICWGQCQVYGPHLCLLRLQSVGCGPRDVRAPVSYPTFAEWGQQAASFHQTSVFQSVKCINISISRGAVAQGPQGLPVCSQGRQPTGGGGPREEPSRVLGVRPVAVCPEVCLDCPEPRLLSGKQENTPLQRPFRCPEAPRGAKLRDCQGGVFPGTPRLHSREGLRPFPTPKPGEPRAPPLSPRTLQTSGGEFCRIPLPERWPGPPSLGELLVYLGTWAGSCLLSCPGLPSAGPHPVSLEQGLSSLTSGSLFLHRGP